MDKKEIKKSIVMGAILDVFAFPAFLVEKTWSKSKLNTPTKILISMHTQKVSTGCRNWNICARTISQ